MPFPAFAYARGRFLHTDHAFRKWLGARRNRLENRPLGGSRYLATGTI